MKIVNFFSEKIPAGRRAPSDGQPPRAAPEIRLSRIPLLLGLLLSALLVSCRDEQAGKDNAGEPLPASFYFDCQFTSAPEAANPYSLYAHIGNYKMKVAELPDCAAVAVADFARYGIPENAAAAAGARHPEVPRVLYAVREAGQILIYQSGSSGDGGPAPSYRLIARYADGQFDFEP